MKRGIVVVLMATLLVTFVGMSVFLKGNNQQTGIASKNITTNTQALLGLATSPALTISEIDLATHTSASNCWVGYMGKVYDLTAWLPQHPGSASAIIPYCGTAKQFEEAFTKQHGTSQVETMMRESTYKGDLK